MANVNEKTLMDAVDILKTYAGFIRNDVRADDFERHPYVPHIEQTIEDLSNTQRVSYCDCEKSHNGLGLAGRQCDCAAPPAMDREAVEKVREAASAMLPKNVCLTNPNWADGTVVPLETTLGELRALSAALSTLSADAIRQGEGLQLAVADALNAAWALCDDTENGDSDQPSVPRDAWKRLADTLDDLEAVIPKSEQPCWPGVAARLLAARDAAGCGVHDDYGCGGKA